MSDHKQFETLRARAALAGITLHAIESDFGRPAFIASWHALTRQWATLEEVEAWLQSWTDGGLPS